MPLFPILSPWGCSIEHKKKSGFFINFYVGLISIHKGPYIAPSTLYIKQYISTTVTMIITIRLHFY